MVQVAQGKPPLSPRPNDFECASAFLKSNKMIPTQSNKKTNDFIIAQWNRGALCSSLNLFLKDVNKIDNKTRLCLTFTLYILNLYDRVCHFFRLNLTQIAICPNRNYTNLKPLKQDIFHQ